MESSDISKETDIKNHTCYCFDEIIKIEDFNLDNILRDEKSNENILVYWLLNLCVLDSIK